MNPGFLARISIDKIWVEGNELVWLTDLDICVGEGVTNLYGSNGCGKSTLIRALAGNLTQDWKINGNVHLCNDTLYICESGLSLFTFRSAIASMYSHASRRGTCFSSAWGAASELIRKINLPISILERDVLTLSAGERKVVAIACAISLRPKLLLVDEPLTFIHSAIKSEVTSWMLEMADAQREQGVMITSHEKIEREPVCNIEIQYKNKTNINEKLFDIISHSHAPFSKNQASPSLRAEQAVVVSSHPTLLGYAPWSRSLNSEIIVKPGKPTLLIGRNGAGKTSLIRTIGSLRPPARGRIFFGEVSIYEKANRESRRYLQEQTAYKLVSPVALDDLLRKDVERVKCSRNILEVLNSIFSRATWIEKPWTLSAGQQNLLSLTAALGSKYPYLNLDEPFSHMAPNWIAESSTLLKQLVKAANLSCILTSNAVDGDGFLGDTDCFICSL